MILAGVLLLAQIRFSVLPLDHVVTDMPKPDWLLTRHDQHTAGEVVRAPLLVKPPADVPLIGGA